MTVNTINSLSTNDALLLQQIAENDGDTLGGLMFETNMSQGRLYALIERLKRRGFVEIQYEIEDMFITLSRQGKQALKKLWPQSTYAM